MNRKTKYFLTVLLLFASNFIHAQCLVAEYPFNGNARDVSGNNFHATVSGAQLTTDRFNHTNSAYYFDGVNDYIEVFYSSKMITGNFTVSCWIYPETVKNQNVVGKADDHTGNYASYQDWAFAATSAGELSGHVTSPAGPPYSVKSVLSSNYTTNKWSHLVMSWDSDTLKVYLNGVLVDWDVRVNSFTLSSRFNLCFGGSSKLSGIQPGRFFKGKIDDVRIYKCELDQDQVDSLYYIADRILEFTEGPACKDSMTYTVRGDTFFNDLAIYFGNGDSVLLKNQKWLTDSLVNYRYNVDTSVTVILKGYVPECNCYGAYRKTLFIRTPPKSKGIRLAQNTSCSQSELSLTDSFFNSLIQRITYGDGSGDTIFNGKLTSSTVEFKHVYDQPGNYNIRYSLLTPVCSYHKDTTVVISFPEWPEQKVGINRYAEKVVSDSLEMCLEDTLYLSDTTNSILTRVNWGDFTEDRSGSSGPRNLSHAFSDTGAFEITVTDSAQNGCVYSSTFQVHVNELPQISILLNDTEQCLNENQLMVWLDPLSHVDSIAQWNIWFGDGSRDSSINVDDTLSHTYLMAGEYDLNYMVKSSLGCSFYGARGFRVEKEPVIQFKLSDTSLCLSGNQFDLSNTSKNVAGDTLSFVLSWGDGTIEAFKDTLSKSHSYISDSSFTITLLAESPLGCSDSIMSVVHVRPQPTAVIDVDSDTICQHAGTVDIRNASVSTDITTVQWFVNAGIPVSTSDQVARRQFDQPGTVLAQLTIQNSYGCSDSVVQTIEIIEKPNFVLIGDTICEGTTGKVVPIRTDGNTFDPLLTETWSVSPDGFNRTQAFSGNPLDYFGSSAGLKTVEYMVESSMGCRDTASTTLLVNERPSAKFTISPNSKTFDSVWIALRPATGQDLTRIWNYGDGTPVDTNNASEIVKSYPAPGDAVIMLTVIDGNGCRDSVTIIRALFPNDLPTDIVWIPNAFSPNNDGINDDYGIYFIGKVFSNYHLQIYNRWGEMLFNSTDPEERWDGKNTIDGTYLFILKIKDHRGVDHEYKGEIKITR